LTKTVYLACVIWNKTHLVLIANSHVENDFPGQRPLAALYGVAHTFFGTCAPKNFEEMQTRTFSYKAKSHKQGRNGGARGAQFPGRRVTMGRRITAGASKSSKNVTSTFFNTVNLLPKELRFEHGGVKLASCPGRHL